MNLVTILKLPELPELEEEAEKVTAEEAEGVNRDFGESEDGEIANPRRPCTSRTSPSLK